MNVKKGRVARLESPASQRWPAYATLPLRFFLGMTFRIEVGADGGLYAG
jgi:hypothetical protein